jgi:hypothetical protein
LLNELEEVATSAVLKNDPKMIPRLVPVEEFQYVSVLQVVEYSNLQKALACKKRIKACQEEVVFEPR